MSINNKKLNTEGLESHIRGDDYFMTLATVLDLFRQSRNKRKQEDDRLLKNKRNELIYLQKHYAIVSRGKKRGSIKGYTIGWTPFRYFSYLLILHTQDI